LGGEIIVVDSGSTDKTVEIARSLGARVFLEEWKGFAAQKNSAIEKASGEWVLSLDADEELTSELAESIRDALNAIENLTVLYSDLLAKGLHANESAGGSELGRASDRVCSAFNLEDVLPIEGPAGALIARQNLFLGRWMKHGGYWPDSKLRLFRRGAGHFEDRLVHEDVKVEGAIGDLRGQLIHHSYPSLSGYIEHMNRYSSLGAQMVVEKRSRGFSIVDIVLRPLATFFYNYVFRLGLLDGREGLLLHLYHAVYVSWKYSKAWEISRSRK
jgi:glycosyltransferase involved in cell wall biosynthesis